MSEKEEPMPCAFCGAHASSVRRYSTTTSPVFVVFNSHSCDCPLKYLNGFVQQLEVWNSQQERYLDARRKDFEAGRLTMAFSRNKSGGEWLEVKTFEDYIKGEQSK